MDEKKLAEILKEAQIVISEKQDVENLKKVLGKVFTENLDLTAGEYKKLKAKISNGVDENGKATKLSSEERRERIKENYYGTCINLLVNILGLEADIMEQELNNNKLLEKIAKKLDIEEE